MNEKTQPGDALSAPLPSPALIQPPVRPAWYWLKRFLACNPFYLLSAALLLFGFYKVSADPGFLKTEISQLIFNYSSLQLYELLIVSTAVLLASRRLWYDSTLLVVLENLLVLVPFILISQAALIGSRLLWSLCAVAAVAACARFGSLRRFIPQINFPARLVGIAALFLIANAVLPALYRILHEHKVGTKPDWGAAYETNQFAWLLLLPTLCALANLLPPPRRAGDFAAQDRFVPLGLFSLWLAGTVVHLYCLGYIYDFSLSWLLVAPAVWMVLWTAYRQSAEFVPGIGLKWQATLLILPALATLLAASSPGNPVFLALTVANLALYGHLYYLKRHRRLVLALLWLSAFTLLGGLPANWACFIVPDFDRGKYLVALAGGCFLIWTMRSPNSKLGVLGALAAAGSAFFVLGDNDRSFPWACQTGLVFVVLHSLRWMESTDKGAASVRLVAAIAWAGHSFWWLHDEGAPWAICATAAPVLGIYLAARWHSGHWGPWPIPVAAIAVLLSAPGDSTAGKLQDAPTGLLAVVGSFLLFGLGTLAALTRRHWHRGDSF